MDESRETGRVFFHYPGVLIAIASTKPFVWDRQAPIRMPNSSGSLPPGDSEFRIDGPTFAATIETAPLDDGATAGMLAWENSGFSVDASVLITLIDRDVPSCFRAWNISCGTVHVRPSR